VQGAVLFVKTHPPPAGLHESSVQGLLSLQMVGDPPTQLPAVHTSPDVQALPSSQDPVFGAFTQPVAALHESSVQLLLSLQLSGVPALHMPPPQTSMPLHALPSPHGAVLFVKTHPPLAGLHESSVQGLLSSHTVGDVPTQLPAAHTSPDVQALPSSQDPAFGALTQPVAALHESSVQVLLSSQLSGVPALHVPPPQTSLPLHALPSPQGAVLFVKTHPPLAGLHESSVHPLLSLHTVGDPPTQLPAAHISPDVHAFPSSHMAVFGIFAQPVTMLHESSVQLLLSLQLSGVPALHMPPPQTSLPLQALPSLQGAVLFAKTHMPSAGLHESSVHPLASLHIVGTVPVHAPAMQTSTVVHAFPSLHGAELFTYTQPVPGTHESFVHALPSLHGSVTTVFAIAELFNKFTSGVFVETDAANATAVPAHCVACKFRVN